MPHGGRADQSGGAHEREHAHVVVATDVVQAWLDRDVTQRVGVVPNLGEPQGREAVPTVSEGGELRCTALDETVGVQHQRAAGLQRDAVRRDLDRCQRDPNRPSDVELDVLGVPRPDEQRRRVASRHELHLAGRRVEECEQHGRELLRLAEVREEPVELREDACR